MKAFLTTFILLLIACTAGAQDINFSQFYELPLLRNPALAGSYKGDFRATAAYRSQWASVTTPYVTEALGVEMKFAANPSSDNYFSIGMQITNDVAGDSKMGRTQLLPVFAFHKSLSAEKDSYLSLGFMGGPVQNRFDPTKIQFEDQYINGSYSAANPTQQVFKNTNVTYMDASVGLVYSSTINNNVKYYVGGSYFHLTKPKMAYDKSKQDIRLPQKVMINAGISGPLSDDNQLIIYADYFQQDSYTQMQGGFMFRHDLVREDEDEAISISAGTFIRWNDAVIPVLKLDYYNMGIGITYDANISKLKAASNMRGGYEITLSYRNFLNIRNSSLEKVRCPVIF
jgi:type IX secretion system PorP/SprF family membrane protein